jgi:hypothetical protein
MSQQIQNELSDALHGAIGAQTRMYTVMVSAVSLVGETQRVQAYSEELGNIEVIVGNNQYLNVEDWIFVLRVFSSQKYQPFLFMGYAGSTGAASLRSPVIWNRAASVASFELLPDRDAGARIGELRLVGESTYYIYDEDDEDGRWEPFAGRGSAKRSFGWYLDGPIIVGEAQGPIFQMDWPSRPRQVAFVAKIGPGEFD